MGLYEAKVPQQLELCKSHGLHLRTMDRWDTRKTMLFIFKERRSTEQLLWNFWEDSHEKVQFLLIEDGVIRTTRIVVKIYHIQQVIYIIKVLILLK